MDQLENIFKLIQTPLSEEYVSSSFTSAIVVGLIACALTGFCTSMLWPGSLIMMEDILPSVGVAAYALMASGGDMGAAIAPQLVGIIADFSVQNGVMIALSERMGVAPDQLGMRIGMLVAAVLALAGVALVMIVCKKFAAKKQQ